MKQKYTENMNKLGTEIDELATKTKEEYKSQVQELKTRWNVLKKRWDVIPEKSGALWDDISEEFENDMTEIRRTYDDIKRRI